MLPIAQDDAGAWTKCIYQGCNNPWSISPFTLGGAGYCRQHAHVFLKDHARHNTTHNVTPQLERLAEVLPRLKVTSIA